MLKCECMGVHFKSNWRETVWNVSDDEEKIVYDITLHTSTCRFQETSISCVAYSSQKVAHRLSSLDAAKTCPIRLLFGATSFANQMNLLHGAIPAWATAILAFISGTKIHGVFCSTWLTSVRLVKRWQKNLCVLPQIVIDLIQQLLT